MKLLEKIRMLIEFLYRYYYTFFIKHLRNEELGKTDGPAWVHTLLQITVGIGLFVFGVVALLFHFLGLFNCLKGLNRIAIILIVAILPYVSLYYLLFKYYQVSKETGKTPRSDFQVSKGWNLFFWCFWILSGVLPIWAILIGNDIL